MSGAERGLLVAGDCPHTVLGYRTFVGEGSKKTGRLDERNLDSVAVQREKESGKGFQRPAGRKRADVESQEKVWEEVEELLRGWQTQAVDLISACLRNSPWRQMAQEAALKRTRQERLDQHPSH